MYKVYCNDVLVHDGSSPSKEIQLVNPSLKLGDNIAGTFTCTLPPGHLAYDMFVLMLDTITVKQDDDIIWKGRPISETRDFWNNRKVTCEGALAFLNDTIQDLDYYENYDPARFLRLLLNEHNRKVDSERGVLYGTVTVTDNNIDYVYETNYKSTYEELKTNLLDRIGGHVIVRYRSDGMAVLDYLESYLEESTQEINFGHNLMDFTRNWDLSQLCTVILPKGAEVKEDLNTEVVEEEESTTVPEWGSDTPSVSEQDDEGTVIPEEETYEQKEYVTIESVNNGSKYLINQTTAMIYGRIERTVEFSDCENPVILKELAYMYIMDMQFDDMTLEVKAIDLHFLDHNISRFNLLEQVHCISIPHGMDRYFPITAIDISLDHPENTTYTLNGSGATKTMSSSNVAITASVDKALRKTTSKHNIIASSLEKVSSILLDYAHISDGIIDNAEISYANVKDLSSNYARIVEGRIIDATIDHAQVDDLDNHYAHIENGVIDNASIRSANVDDLENKFAHIENGVIDNAKINHGDVKDLSSNYARIENGVIVDATIRSANIDDLTNRFAHIENGEITNAKISYGNVKNLEANYAKINFSNVNNTWIKQGVIREGAISDAMILSLGADKITAGTLDASQITVTNLNATNITTGTINGQRFAQGSIALSKLEEEVYSKEDIDDILIDINDRLDSAIETYTGNAIPLLSNYPASDWSSNDVKDTHVGDVYYVVNQNMSENGYAYRFSKINNTYSWELIKDTDVTSALSNLQSLDGRVGTIERFDNDISTWKTSVDGNISALTTSHTSLETSVGKTVVKMTQLWYTKADTSLPSTPMTHITSDSVGPNAWTTAVPIFDSENPNYFYCWEYEYKDGTYSVSDPVFDRVMSQSQLEAYGGIIASYQLWTIGPTEDVPAGPTGIGGPYSIVHLLDRDVLLDSDLVPITDSNGDDYTINVASQDTIDFLKCGNLEYMHDSNGATIDDNTDDPYLTGLRWTIEVPSYDPNNPNYFYCWEYHYLDGTVDWSEGVLDRATTQAQKKSADVGEELNRKVDIVTFNRLKHTTDENSAEITRLSTTVTENNSTVTTSINNITQTAEATSNKITRMINRLKLNEDGSAGEEDIVYQYSELYNGVDEFKQVVGETYYTKEEAKNFTIGGRNLLHLTREFISTSLSDEFGESIYDSSDRNILTSKSKDGYLNTAESILTFDTYRDLTVRRINLSTSDSDKYVTFAEYSNVIVPEIDKNYILSFYAKGSTKLSVYFTNGSISETIEAVTSQDVETESFDGEAEITVNNLWSRHWVKWTPRGTATNVARNVVIRVYGRNQIYICGLKFEESSTATDWSPAPEDGEELIEDKTKEIENALIERVVQAETAIVKTSESIELKADKNETYTISDIDGIIQETVDSQSAELLLTANQILSTVARQYATTYTVGSLSNRVTSMQTSIRQTENAIALKADQSTTYTKTEVDGLISTEIKARNAAITLSADGINSHVSETYLSKVEFGDMSIGGRNYLMFTKTFEDVLLTDSNGWAILDSSGIAFGEEEDRYLAGGCAMINPQEQFQDFTVRELSASGDDPNTYFDFAIYKNVIAPIPDHSYIFSFYAKGEGEIVACFYPNPTGGTCSAKTSQNNESEDVEGLINFTLSSNWTRYWVMWTIGGQNSNSAKRNVGLRLYCGETANDTNRAYVCGCKFEEGTVATAWSPAIEDSGITLEQYIEELRKKIDDTNRMVDEKINASNYSIVQMRADFDVKADRITSEVEKKTDKGSIISTINQSAEEVKISADKITLEGTTTFASFAKTSDIPTKISQLDNDSLYQTESQITTAIENGTAKFAEKTVAIKSMRLIYYATSSSNAPALPTNTEVTDTSANANRWTLIRPTLNSVITNMYISTQTVFVNGNVNWSPVKKDNTTTNFAGIYQAVSKVQLIYYATNVDVSPTTPTTWITSTSMNAINAWTTIRPNYNPSYPYVYQATQSEYVDGNVSTSNPTKDNLESTFATKTDAIGETQYIYKSVARGVTSVSRPSSWVTKDKNQDGSDVQNDWTISRPKWDKDYPNLFIAKQEKTLNGQVRTTTPIKDESLTVIDGGYITTGSIDASSINLNTINVSSLEGAGAYATISDIEDRISGLTKYVGAEPEDLVQNGIFTSSSVSGWTIQSGTNISFVDGYLLIHSNYSGTNRYGIYQNVSVPKSGTVYDVTIEVNPDKSFHVGVSTSSSGYPTESSFVDIGKGRHRFSITSTNTKIIRIYIYATGSTASVDGDTYIKSVSVTERLEYSNILPLSEQKIYINWSSGFIISNPTSPSYWVTSTKDTSTSDTDWTTVRPRYNPDRPILFVAKQTMYLDGTVVSTPSVRDTSYTVINGGFITTGTVDAEHIDVENIKIRDLNTEGSNLLVDSQTIYFMNILRDDGYETYFMSEPNTWITRNVSVVGGWTKTKPSRMNWKNSILYVSIQKKSVSGDITWTPPVRDYSWDDDGSKVSETSYIYISKPSGTLASDLTMPSAWVTDATGYQNRWTRTRPVYNKSYPVLFICQQNKRFDGYVYFTDPKIDETTTVIDGGHITTGTIDCNAVTVANIDASNITTGRLNAELITTGYMSATRISGGYLDFEDITALHLDIGEISATNITTGTLEVGNLRFTYNDSSVRSGRVNYIKDLSFSWHYGNSLSISTNTMWVDGDLYLMGGRIQYNGRWYDSPVVALEIGFDCEIEYDTLEFSNGLCVDYTRHSYVTEAPSTTYM